MNIHFHRLPRTMVLLAALALPGWAAAQSSVDPLEPMNRKLYQANEVLDKYVVKPVIRTYTKVAPQFVRTGVANVFSNIGDLFSGVNGLLQAKPGKAGQDLGRVAVNTTVGVLGLFDVASKLDLEHGEEDFGQTFGYWGLGQGPYLFIPLFGPTTVRDGAGMVLRALADPVGQINDIPVRNGVYTLGAVDLRADAENALNIADTAALDRYRFIRNAYLQRRLYLLHDGEPPAIEE